MGLRLIVISQKKQIERGCRVCKGNFQLSEPVFSTTRSTGGSASTNLYHVNCARQVNLTVAEQWWNRLTKYKRKTMLIDLEIEVLEIEECYELPYRKLPDEIKIQIDIRYYKK